MKEVYDFLVKTEVNYLSTIDGGKPSCRPFGVPIIYDDKIYILTSKHKKVSKQINKNNNVCIVAYDRENWIRINCKLMDDSNNTNVKAKFLEEFDDLEEAGYSLDNPAMQVLYMSDVVAILYDEDGIELKKYCF